AQGHLLQLEDVLLAGARAPPSVFVLELNAQYGPAVLPEQAFDLSGDLVVEALDKRDVRLGDRAKVPLRHPLHEPVREPPVPRLAVVPGTYAKLNVHPVPGAELHEAAQVAAARPVVRALRLLVVDPEDVG